MQDTKGQQSNRAPWGNKVLRTAETTQQSAKAYAYYRVFGILSFEAQYGIRSEAVRRYGRYLDHPAFSEIYEAEVAALQATLPFQRAIGETPAGLGRMKFKGVGAYSEKDFQSMIGQQMATVMRQMGFPPVESMSFEHRLAGIGRIDALLGHTDGTLTIMEIKSDSRQKFVGSGWSVYPMIGQVLFYMEALIAEGVAEDRIRLAIVTDFDSPMLKGMLRHVNVPIAYHNASYIMD